MAYILLIQKNHFTFYHGKGKTTATTKDIKDEYARLQRHQLHIITQHVRHFLNHRKEVNDPCDVSNMITVIIININAQSLIAHVVDIESDPQLQKSDYLAITETWIDSTNPIQLSGFELQNHINNSAVSYTMDCNNNKLGTTGDVAICRNVNSVTQCKIIENDYTATTQTNVNKIANRCFV